MLELNQLCLPGSGIVDEIFYSQTAGELMVRINVSQEKNEKASTKICDEIYLNCIVCTEKHRDLISSLISKIVAGACVQLKVVSEFVAFEENFQDHETHQNLLTIRANLLEVTECFVDATRLDVTEYQVLRKTA